VNHFLYVPCFEYFSYIKIIKGKKKVKTRSNLINRINLPFVVFENGSPFSGHHFQAQMAPISCGSLFGPRFIGEGMSVLSALLVLVDGPSANQNHSGNFEMEMGKSPSESFGVNV